MVSKKWPVLAGVIAAVGLLVFYLLLVGLTSRSWPHAFALIADDWPYVAAITAGFGTQMGLYTYLRRIIRQRSTGGNLVATAGTGTSTATMVACCLHHLADVAPVIGLSGAAIFLSQYKYPVMSIGIAANVVGIAIMLRTIRRHSRAAC